jgi:hypothetical protein
MIQCAHERRDLAMATFAIVAHLIRAGVVCAFERGDI